jgi:radical SAM/Cys-rich protein
VTEGAGPPLESVAAGPKPTTSLAARRSPLVSTRAQVARLSFLDLKASAHRGSFPAAAAAAGHDPLLPGTLEIFQINVGRLCNMTCLHCHVDAGPDRVEENMSRETMEACLRVLDQTSAHTVDITGGAPELNPHFRWLVDQCRARGKKVMDRCNLTVLLLPRSRDLPAWFAEREVEVVCSLPHYRRRNTDKQRGEKAFEKSIEALKRLNAAGYGRGDDCRRLTLVSNPVGAYLTGDQAELEKEWKRALAEEWGVSFDRLILINNMPISRFLDWLLESGNLQGYMELLANAFNPATVAGLMCRNTLSVSWDGKIYDCDFNQMLELDSRYPGGEPAAIEGFDPALWARRQIITARHCFGCTAGAGSSCGGAISA